MSILGQDTMRDLRYRIAQGATEALLDLPHNEIKVWAYYDVLMAALPDWQVVAQFDVTKLAKDPFAWFLFRHKDNGAWMSYRSFTPCLSHPFDGNYIHTRLVWPANMTVGPAEDTFLDEVFALTRAGNPGPRAEGDDTVVEPLEEIHARWVLAHFSSEKARAYSMLLGLMPPSSA